MNAAADWLPLLLATARSVPSPWTSSDPAEPLAPGDALIVAVGEKGATLSRLCYGAEPESKLFDLAAQQAWRDAGRALSRAMTCLWMLPSPAPDPPRAIVVGAVARLGVQSSEPPLFEGGSFGLAFLLARASAIVGEPLRRDTVALAGIAESGRVTRVDRLSEKIAAVGTLAGAASRLIVCKDQVDEARVAASSTGQDLVVVGVGNAEEAVQYAIERELPALLARSGRTPAERRLRANAMLQLIITRDTDVFTWKPVEKAATTALEAWRLSRQERDTRWLLEFVAGVAARHDVGKRRLPGTSRRHLRQFHWPLETRLFVIANYVQHSADVGHPDALAVKRLVASSLARRDDALPGHAAVRGALARLATVRGEHARALKLQAEAFEILFLNGRLSETSYQLSEWFRLAATLNRAEAFRAANRALDRVQKRKPFDLRSRLFVDLSRGYAMTRFGDLTNGRRVLRDVLDRALETGPLYLASSAARRLLASGSSDSLPDFDIAPDYRALIALDRANLTGDDRAIRRALAGFRKQDPGVARQLVKEAVRRRARPGAYVARHYPY